MACHTHHERCGPGASCGGTARCPAQGAGPRACLVVPRIPPGRQGCAVQAPLLPAATHPPPRGLGPRQHALRPAGSSCASPALAPCLSRASLPSAPRARPAPARSWSRLRPLLALRCRSPDSVTVSPQTLRWEQTFLLSSVCVVLPAPRAHAGVLASASLRGLWPCLCSRVALPRPAPRDRVWAPKSDVSVHSPFLRVCVLVLSSEHFSEFAVSLLLSFCLSGLRSHAVVTAEHRAVACVHAQPLLPSLPFKDRAGG